MARLRSSEDPAWREAGEYEHAVDVVAGLAWQFFKKDWDDVSWGGVQQCLGVNNAACCVAGAPFALLVPFAPPAACHSCCLIGAQLVSRGCAHAWARLLSVVLRRCPLRAGRSTLSLLSAASPSCSRWCRRSGRRRRPRRCVQGVAVGLGLVWCQSEVVDKG